MRGNTTSHHHPVAALGDALVWREDADCVHTSWLRDPIIHLWWEWLLIGESGDDEQTLSSEPSLARCGGCARACAIPPLLLPPAVTQLWRCLPPDSDTLHAILPPEWTEQMTSNTPFLALLPLNDQNAAGNAASGSHWSLLVLYRRPHELDDEVVHAWHYDSAPGVHEALAREFCAQQVSAALGDGKARVHYMPVHAMPRQQNGMDCGVYVCEVARWLCQAWARSAAGDEHGMTAWTSPPCPTAGELYPAELRLLLGVLLKRYARAV
jgi:hypothetical protein